ncbi:MAG: formylglycine-generating enzyme family protein [Verrucomicrobiales bacterium]|nr:formylglycine-generating enzyme family protein [Verrucomicrobiales bacterium]
MKVYLAALGVVMGVSSWTAPWIEIGREETEGGERMVLTLQTYGYGLGVLQRSKDLRNWEPIHAMELPREGIVRLERSTTSGAREFLRFVSQTIPIPTDMVWIAPGEFLMGSPLTESQRHEDEGPQRLVRIQYGFWMGRYEVTVREFRELMGWNPTLDAPDDSTRPVESVTWDEAMEFCRRRTVRDRLGNAIPPGASYRLPSEAEWEYACRAGTTTRYSFGDDPGHSVYIEYGWSALNAKQFTHPVGLKKSNQWGLHDMHGNVFEWCLDRYGAYPGGVAVRSITNHVYRGGSWYCSDLAYLRSASRHPGNQSTGRFIGFRLLLGSPADTVLAP